ncbi:hypothetical protein BS78_08G127000 [Paspalum vaginatum]|nr:hypothetical protein BS78_08G127000 [Paspalum vaginatum]KAJ1266124.1 hypothetical protein BS78_08G127000 [Paspalum vaginatum]
MSEWDDYPRYLNPDGVAPSIVGHVLNGKLLSLFLGTTKWSASQAYTEVYCLRIWKYPWIWVGRRLFMGHTFRPASSPLPTIDGQMVGAQNYPHPTAFFQPPTPIPSTTQGARLLYNARALPTLGLQPKHCLSHAASANASKKCGAAEARTGGGTARLQRACVQ